VTVVSLVTVAVLPAGTAPVGRVSDWVTVVVVVPGAGATVSVGATVGSLSRSTGAYCACDGGGCGFGCEHETRQIAKRRETIFFIFYSALNSSEPQPGLREGDWEQCSGWSL